MKHYKIKKLLTNNVKDFVKYNSFIEISINIYEYQ